MGEIPKKMSLRGKSLTIVIALLAAGLKATAAASSTLRSHQTVPAGGTITSIQSVDVSIYADSACTQTVSFVDWGALKPGDSTTKTI